MLNIDFLQNSWYFKKISLNSWDILFNEWDIDNNLYFILSWEVSIEKYTSIERKNTKKLAILKDMDFFWEGSLNNNKPKEVKIIANTKVELLFIEAKTWLQKFIKNNPIEWLNLLSYLINITNERLLESNSLITATYNINNEINSLKKIDTKWIFTIINTIKTTLNCKNILYLEKFEAIEKMLVLRYDTSKWMKILNELIEMQNNTLDLSNIKDFINNYNLIENISIWDKNLWYLVFCKENNNFTKNEKKIITSIIPSLAWIIRQREIIKEEIDKNYIKNN